MDHQPDHTSLQSLGRLYLVATPRAHLTEPEFRSRVRAALAGGVDLLQLRCKEMDALTFSNARVKPKLDGMLLLQADVTANTAEHKALLKSFHLFGPPGIIFFDAQGREVKGLRVIGYQNAERFLRTLELAGAR